jgi:hypothetical protein
MARGNFGPRNAVMNSARDTTAPISQGLTESHPCMRDCPGIHRIQVTFSLATQTCTKRPHPLRSVQNSGQFDC